MKVLRPKLFNRFSYSSNRAHPRERVTVKPCQHATTISTSLYQAAAVTLRPMSIFIGYETPEAFGQCMQTDDDPVRSHTDTSSKCH
jgi:hypothetical protein